MSFDPEIVRSIRDHEPEYTEDFRERYALAPVFERAREKQIELSQTQIRGEDLAEAWGLSQEFIWELNAQANEQGVMGEEVRLSGNSLEKPTLISNLSQGAALISQAEPVVLSEDTVHEYYKSQEAEGAFAGFTIRYVGSGEKVYTPRLSYQVAVAATDVPQARITLFATGAVGEAHLSFKADEKMEATAPLVEELYELCSKRLGKLSRLHTTLASTEKYDAPTIRGIAFDAAKVLQAADRTKAQYVEDKLIDLITQYIEPGSRLALTTQSLVSDTFNRDEGASYHEARDEDEVCKLQGVCMGLIFRNRPTIQDGALRGRQKHKTLHAVFETPTAYVYVPLTRVREFENL